MRVTIIHTSYLGSGVVSGDTERRHQGGNSTGQRSFTMVPLVGLDSSPSGLHLQGFDCHPDNGLNSPAWLLGRLAVFVRYVMSVLQ